MGLVERSAVSDANYGLFLHLLNGFKELVHQKNENLAIIYLPSMSFQTITLSFIFETRAAPLIIDQTLVN